MSAGRREKFMPAVEPPIGWSVKATTGTARRRRWTGVAAVLVVLIVGGLASGGASLAFRKAQDRLGSQAMDDHLKSVSDAITDEISHYSGALGDIAAAIGTQTTLTRADFLGLTESTSYGRLPGASAISFSVPTSDAQVASTQALWRSRGATGLSLYRTTADAEHAFVVYTRTLTGATAPAGRDLLQIAESADALRVARETGTFTVSHSHILIRDRTLPVTEQQMSFTLAVPAFGPAGATGVRPLLGWVTMGVRGGDFLVHTLQKQSLGVVQVSLEDPLEGTEKAIAGIAPGEAMHAPGLARTETLNVGNHSWRLLLRPTTLLLSASDRWASKLTLLGGLAVTFLLAALAGVLAGARNRALAQVDEATAALRQDIRRREEVEAELNVLVFTDQLTGLANRALFYDRVGHALNTHLRAGGTFAVFFIDLDGFKQVNDQLGHGAGDLVLKEVAVRLRRCLRDSDTVARFGGDEFAVIADWLADPGDVHITAGRIVAAVREPIDVGGPVRASVTASVGIALNRPGDSADEILREADLAMYTAKTTGKCRHVLAGQTSEQV